MTDNGDMKVFTDYVNLRDDDLQAIQAAWRILHPQMMRFIDGFYDRLDLTPFAAPLADVDVARLKQQQMQYWGRLFSGTLDEDYYLDACRIGSIHMNKSVPLHAYIGAYAWFSECMFDALAKSSVDTGFSRNKMMHSVNKLIYLDMIVASSAYSEAQRFHFLD